MEEKKIIEYDRIFRALGDKHRLQILDILMQGQRNAGELLEMVDVVQSTLSHHMKSLCEAGLVTARREGKWTYYTVSEKTVELAREFLRRYLDGDGIVPKEPAWEEDEAKIQKEEPQEMTKSTAKKRIEKNSEPQEESGDEMEVPPITLYANMKPTRKKKSEKSKKASRKKKGKDKKKTKKDSDRKDSEKGKDAKREADTKKEKKGSKKEIDK